MKLDIPLAAESSTPLPPPAGKRLPPKSLPSAEPAPARPSWRPALLAALGIGLTSAGHYLTPPDLLLWHGLFQRLYYLPVVYAAIRYGWVGGLAAALVSGCFYVPHILTTWSHSPHYAFEQYAEIFMFFCVGLVTGILADRERRQRANLQETAAKLRQVYRELQESFEQVQRADRLSAIGQLAAGLAHEIRNPLASIDGAAEVLEAGTEPPEVRQEIVGIVRKECARLNRLLSGLLDFARPRDPEWTRVDLGELLDSVVELVQHSAGRGIHFVRDTPKPLPTLLGDREQLAQVLLNLTLNAAQAMPAGGEVRLSAQPTPEGVVLEVKDEGSGIAAELLDRIFDPFFTTKDTGTGLGLSVVHQIVTRHGGRIEAERNPTRGMTFRVVLPTDGRGAQ